MVVGVIALAGLIGNAFIYRVVGKVKRAIIIVGSKLIVHSIGRAQVQPFSVACG